MTDKLKSILTAIGYPYAYKQFAEGEDPEVPFICFDIVNDNNFYAEGVVYFRSSKIELNLSTKGNDPASEKHVEDVLTEYGVGYAFYDDENEVTKLSERKYSFTLEE